MPAETLELQAVASGFDELRKQLDTTDKRIDQSTKRWGGLGKIAGGAGKILGTVGKVGLTAVAAAGATATAAIGGFIKAGMPLAQQAGKYMSIKDSFQSMSKGMISSTEEFEAKVAEASAGTLDDLTILTGGTRALSLIGREAFTDFEGQFADMAGFAKKAARATGYDVSYMFDSLITGMSRESKMILDNLGITVDLTQAKEDYAASLGKEKDELTTAESKAAVMQHTLELLEQTYGDVSASSGGISGATQQLGTAMTNLKKDIGIALVPIFNTLTRVMSEVVAKVGPKLLAFVQKIAPHIEKVATAFGDFVSALLDGESPMEAFKDLMADLGLERVAEVVEQVASAIRDVIDAVRSGVSGFQEEGIFVGLENLFSGLDISVPPAFWNVLNTIITLPDTIRSAFAGFQEEGLFVGLENLFAGLGVTVPPEFWEVLNKIVLGFDMLKGVFNAIKDTVLPPLQEAFASISNTLGSDVGPIVEKAGPLFDSFKRALAAAAKVIGAVVVAAIGLLSGVISGLAKGVAAAFPSILKIISGVMTALTGIFNTFAGIVDWLTGLIMGDTEKQKEAWERMKSGVVQIVTGLWEAVKGIFEGAIALVSGFVEGLVEGVVDFFTNLKERLVGGSIIPEMWEAIKGVFKGAIEEIKGFVSGLIESVVGFFQNRNWGEIGRAMIDGIKQGVIDAAAGLAAAALEAAENALNAVKGWLGIACPDPSPVFAEIGTAMGEGVLQGWRSAISDFAPTAVASVAGVGGRVYNDSRSFVNNYNLTTQSITRPGTLRMEFGAMEVLASR